MPGHVETETDTEALTMVKEKVSSASINIFFGTGFACIIASLFFALTLFITMVCLWISASVTNASLKVARFEINDVYFQFNQLKYDPKDLQDPLASLDVYFGLTFLDYEDGTTAPDGKILFCRIPDYNATMGSLWSRCRNSAFGVIQTMKVCRQVLGKLTCDAYSPELGKKYLDIYRNHCVNPKLEPSDDDGLGSYLGDDGKILEKSRIDFARGCESIRRNPVIAEELAPLPDIYFTLTASVCFIVSAFIIGYCISYHDGKVVGRNQIRDLVNRTTSSRDPPSSSSSSSLSNERLQSLNFQREYRERLDRSTREVMSSQLWELSTLRVKTNDLLQRCRLLDEISSIELLNEIKGIIVQLLHFRDVLLPAPARGLQTSLDELYAVLGRFQSKSTGNGGTITSRRISELENSECPITLGEIKGDYSQCSHCRKNFSKKAINDWIRSGHIECPLCRKSLSTMLNFTTFSNRREAFVVNVGTEGESGSGVDGEVDACVSMSHPNEVPVVAEASGSTNLHVPAQG